MSEQLEQLLSHALHEDCPAGDITSDTLSLPDTLSKATLIAKQDGIFFGKEIITTLLKKHAPTATLSYIINNADPIKSGDPIAIFNCPATTCLILERVLLNLLQRLSGIATQTHQFVTALNDPNIQILDTRKTTPGLRFLEKQAVKAGGGFNHRDGLSDMILIKENHLTTFFKTQSQEDLSKRILAKKIQQPSLKAEIEIETLTQLQTYNFTGFDYILLDNFSLPDLEQAFGIIKERQITAEIEISGNITLDRIKLYRNKPIHRISVGALTHSVPAFDISLLIDYGNQASC